MVFVVFFGSSCWFLLFLDILEVQLQPNRANLKYNILCKNLKVYSLGMIGKSYPYFRDF